MKEYKRLTTKCEVGIGLTETSGNIVNDYEKVINRLAELEDKIENGTLIELPCKVDDTVYAVSYKKDRKVGQIRECIVDYISVGYKKEVYIHFDCDYDCECCFFSDWRQDYSGEFSCFGEYGDGIIPFIEFGKSVFLTKAEAEAKLKELQNER